MYVFTKAAKSKRSFVASRTKDWENMKCTSLWLIETANECGCNDALRHLKAAHTIILKKRL
mgnify:CR=1 FL=1